MGQGPRWLAAVRRAPRVAPGLRALARAVAERRAPRMAPGLRAPRAVRRRVPARAAVERRAPRAVVQVHSLGFHLQLLQSRC